jgi:ribA/ribD-fused uncharacterized protein
MYFKDYPFLSNFHPCKIIYNNVEYPSVENAYQAQKCPERSQEFINISAKDAKNLGKKVEVRPDWDEIKLKIMWDLVHQKFEDPQLLSQLKAIKEPIAEHNWWHDNYWGICTCDKCKDVPAHNWLGKILENIKNS